MDVTVGGGNMMWTLRRIRLLGAVVVVAALVPFNMGGCSSSGVGNLAGDIVGKATGDSSLGSRTGRQVTAGVNTAKALTIDERAEKAMGESVVLALTNRHKLSADAKLAKYVSL